MGHSFDHIVELLKALACVWIFLSVASTVRFLLLRSMMTWPKQSFHSDESLFFLRTYVAMVLIAVIIFMAVDQIASAAFVIALISWMMQDIDTIPAIPANRPQ